jgi:phosphoglycolate phosphatase
MLSAVVFDFDGTIANTLPFTFKKIIEIAKKMKIKKINDLAQKELIKKIRSSTYEKLLKEFEISWLKYPLIIWEIKKAQKELGKEIDKIKPFPKIDRVLKKIKREKLQIFILSSNIKSSIETFIKNHNWQELIDDIYTGSNLLGKDKDLIYMLKKHKLKKDEVIYVADELRDVLACKKIGIEMIGVAWGLHYPRLLKEYGAKFIAKKPEDILLALSDRLSNK